jgi:hypothetical protein
MKPGKEVAIMANAKRKVRKRPKHAARQRSQRPTRARNGRRRKWSAAVARRSNALDLEKDVFKLRSPTRIAASLKRAAERSTRRKGTPLQSAMSMLNFYINRAGRRLSPARKRLLERTKPALREAFGRTP